VVNRFGETGSYDQVTSPISRPGSTRSVLGQGGLVDADGGFVGDLANGDFLGAIQTAKRTARTFRNADVRAVIKSDLLSNAKTATGNRGAFNIPSVGSGSDTVSQQSAGTGTPSNIPPVV
jgi:hypothetical protein